MSRLRRDLNLWWRRALEWRPLWIGLALVVATWSLLPRPFFFAPQLEPGSIAPRTFIADRDLSLANASATAEAQRRAEEAVLTVYDLDESIESERRLALAALFAAGRQMLEGEAAASAAGSAPAATAEADEAGHAARHERLAAASSLRVQAEMEAFLRARRFAADLEDRLAGLMGRVLRQGVAGDKNRLLENRDRGITIQRLPSGVRDVQLDLYDFLDYPDEMRQAVAQDLLAWEGLTARQRQTLTTFIADNVTPNLTLNSSETLALRLAARDDVRPLSFQIRQGEVIVRKGERVGELAARAVARMAGSRGIGGLLLTGLGTILLVAAMILVLWRSIGQERPADRSCSRLLNECLLLLILHVVGARFAFFVAEALSNAIQREPFSAMSSYVYAIPFGALALIAVLLYGRQTALVLSLIFALFVGHMAGGGEAWQLVLYSLAGSLAAVYALDRYELRQRSVTTTVGVMVGLVNVATILMLKSLLADTAGGMPQLGFDLICGFIGGLLIAAVASFAVPILEGLLSITTMIKLIELSNPNLPLLRRLAFEAPGSFQHSLAVANLAQSGCEAIGADSLLVNTCALYHDVGKIRRPQYFIENQAPGQNPHDKIQPSMSALILINHVKEGLELAHEHHLPRPIIEAIEQHHGTRLIKFFFNRALERCDPDTEAIREDEFRYPGPKPKSKEMGVLMLADAVEAASRTLVEPSRQRIRTMLRQIFSDCLGDNQLDQTDLTLGDLRQVEDAFLRILTNIYHRRVDYPGFDFNRESRKKRASSTDSRIVPASTLDERRKAS